MTLLDTLTPAQKETLRELKEDYLNLIAKKGEIPSLRARIIEIDDELREHEKSIKQNNFG